jgi:uncharacterized protein
MSGFITINPRVGALSELFKIYDSLPKIDCKRKCADHCGPWNASAIENKAIGQFLNGKIRGLNRKNLLAGEVTCPYLEKEIECSIYGVRPLICRCFGLTPELACPHGCIPERWISTKEMEVLFRKIRTLV